MSVSKVFVKNSQKAVIYRSPAKRTSMTCQKQVETGMGCWFRAVQVDLKYFKQRLLTNLICFVFVDPVKACDDEDYRVPKYRITKHVTPLQDSLKVYFHCLSYLCSLREK